MKFGRRVVIQGRADIGELILKTRSTVCIAICYTVFCRARKIRPIFTFTRSIFVAQFLLACAVVDASDPTISSCFLPFSHVYVSISTTSCQLDPTNSSVLHTNYFFFKFINVIIRQIRLRIVTMASANHSTGFCQSMDNIFNRV